MSERKPKPSGPAADTPVPKAVVSRLSLYLRELQHLVRDGHQRTSSGPSAGSCVMNGLVDLLRSLHGG